MLERSRYEIDLANAILCFEDRGLPVECHAYCQFTLLPMLPVVQTALDFHSYRTAVLLHP